MFYIPDAWLKDKKNHDKVRDILDGNLYTDINIDENVPKAIEALEAIGETRIIDKIKDGTITIG
jgi:hypothetical protein